MVGVGRRLDSTLSLKGPVGAYRKWVEVRGWKVTQETARVRGILVKPT